MSPRVLPSGKVNSLNFKFLVAHLIKFSLNHRLYQLQQNHIYIVVVFLLPIFKPAMETRVKWERNIQTRPIGTETRPKDEGRRANDKGRRAKDGIAEDEEEKREF